MGSSVIWRVIYALLMFVNAALVVLIGGADAAGMSPMVKLLMQAAAAGLGVVLGLPFVLALSSLEPGRSERAVAKEAILTGRLPGGPA